jgi:SLAP domain-containing protein
VDLGMVQSSFFIANLIAPCLPFMYKRLLLVIFTLLFLFITVCSCSKDSSTSISFSPINSANYSKKEKDYLHEQIKKAGALPKGVSFYGYDATFEKDGRLIVKGFIRNNTGKQIYNIQGTIAIMDKKKLVAKAYFICNLEQFGKLNNKDSRPWTLIYPEVFVKKEAFNLAQYTIEADMEYTFLGVK